MGGGLVWVWCVGSVRELGGSIEPSSGFGVESWELVEVVVWFLDGRGKVRCVGEDGTIGDGE